VIVGTQLGILSVFNRSAGWGDCVDRIPGHPHSVDAVFTLAPDLCPSTDIIATGSSDGMVRLVQILPTKVLGVVADHEDFPVERIKGDMPGANATTPQRWIGSISHEDILKLTDLGDALEESDDDEADEERAPITEGGSGTAKRIELGDDSSDEEEQTFVDWGTPSVPKSPLRSNVTTKKATTTNITTTIPEPVKRPSNVRKASEAHSDAEKEQFGYSKDSTSRKKRKKVEKGRGGMNDVVGDFSDL